MNRVKTMETKTKIWNMFGARSRLSQPVRGCLNSKGQALVEFTFVFILLLVIAWIPADFGLAFYTGQLAQNASREGARIAAADPTAATQTGTCALSACFALDSNTARYRAATRVAAALMPDTTVSLAIVPNGTCNQMVQMTVSGTYNFFFYRLLGWFGITTSPAAIERQTTMRWEHQC